ncbi:MAG: nucleotide exchange factor GrpE [Ignavibacteriae bacterium]|nr:nucleotide exchange factor GrpE [Ignavibacteriota bacterium]
MEVNIKEEQNSTEVSEQVAQEQPETAVPDNRIEELEKTIGQLKDQLLRKAAEFENYKRRTENDYLERVRYANEDLIFDLLPVLDDFERSLKLSREKKDFDSFFRGVELIYQKCLKLFAKQGVEAYEVIGKEFDPHLHDALMQLPKSDVPPHMILEEVEKGYMMYGKVLRHAKVVVSGEVVEESQPAESVESATEGVN